MPIKCCFGRGLQARHEQARRRKTPINIHKRALTTCFNKNMLTKCFVSRDLTALPEQAAGESNPPGRTRRTCASGRRASAVIGAKGQLIRAARFQADSSAAPVMGRWGRSRRTGPSGLSDQFGEWEDGQTDGMRVGELVVGQTDGADDGTALGRNVGRVEGTVLRTPCPNLTGVHISCTTCQQLPIKFQLKLLT